MYCFLYTKLQDRQVIDGGHHTHPEKRFFIGTKIYELDVKGQYHSIVYGFILLYLL